MVNDVDAYRAANNLDGVGSIPSRLSDLYSFTNAVIYRKYDVLDKILEVKVIIYKDHYDLNQVFLERNVFVPEFNFKGIITRIQELTGDKYEITIKEPGWHFTRRLYKIGGATEWDVAVTTSDSYTAHLQEILDSANLDMPFTWTLNDGIPTGVELNFKLNHKSHYEYLSISAMNAGYNLWFDGPRVSVGVKGKDIKIDRKDVIFKKLETDQDLDVYANILKFIGGKDSGGTKLSKTETVVNDLKYDYETAVVNTEIETSGVLDSLAPKVLANTSNLDPDVEMSVTREIYDKYAFESGDRVELLSKDANQKTEGIFRIIEISVSVDNANPDKIDIKLMKNKENVFAPAFKSLTDALDIIYDKISDIEIGNLDGLEGGSGIGALGTITYNENGTFNSGAPIQVFQEDEDKWFKSDYNDNADIPITELINPQQEHVIGNDVDPDQAWINDTGLPHKIHAGGWIRVGVRSTTSSFLYKSFRYCAARLRKVGNPNGNVTFTIRNDSTDAIEASGSIPISQIGTSFAVHEFDLGVIFGFGGTTARRFLVEYSGGDASNYIEVDGSGTANGFRLDRYDITYTNNWIFNNTVSISVGYRRTVVDESKLTILKTLTADDFPPAAALPGLDAYLDDWTSAHCILVENQDSVSRTYRYKVYIYNSNSGEWHDVSQQIRTVTLSATHYGSNYWGYAFNYGVTSPEQVNNTFLKPGDKIGIQLFTDSVATTDDIKIIKSAIWIYPHQAQVVSLNVSPILNNDAIDGEPDQGGNALSPNIDELTGIVLETTSTDIAGYLNGNNETGSPIPPNQNQNGGVSFFVYGNIIYWEGADRSQDSSASPDFFCPKLYGIGRYNYIA